MAFILDENNSIDGRIGIKIELNFIKIGNMRLLTGCLRNIDDDIAVIRSPDLKAVTLYERGNVNGMDEWLNFYELFILDQRISEYGFSNPLMSVWFQVIDTAINSKTSIFKVGFNLCLINGVVTWKGKGPISTEMVVSKDKLRNFIDNLNAEYQQI